MKPQAQPGDLPLEDCADEDQAVVFDFVVAYFDDLDAGRQQRLADYLTRFPGHESIIAAEYLRQEDLRGERIPDEAVGGTSDQGDGLRCVGGSWIRRFSALSTGSTGAFSMGPGMIDTIETQWGPGVISPGTTMYFQSWGRDIKQSPCGSGSNLSNGLAVTFTL